LTVDDIAKSLDNKKTVDAAVLDFSKAFDKVPHNRLIHKICHYGIRGALAEWLRSFLTNRTQCVVVDGQSSAAADVLSGVPQGTVLGPLLFLLYINDLPEKLESSCRLFADDCLVYSDISSSADTEILQRDLQKLEKWQNDWLMSFNPKKCSTITFATRDPPKREYTFCGETLKSEDSTTYLGVQLANNLSWNNQTQNAVTKAQKVLGLVRRNLWNCPEKVKTTAYQALVRPHLEYAVGAWCPYRMKNVKAVERIQVQAARFCKRNYSREKGTVTGILEELGWATLEDRRTIHNLTLMYKIRNKLLEVTMDGKLAHNPRKTRGHNQKYHEPAARLDVYKNSFFPSTIKLWNKLPSLVAEAKTLGTFKSSLQEHVCGQVKASY
jgi:hypothetical protein